MIFSDMGTVELPGQLGAGVEDCIAEARGPFFESPENFSGPKSLLILYVVKGTKVKIT